MISLEKQVSSLELSKRLKELGIKQDSRYSYFQYDKWNVVLRETREIFTPNNECGYNMDNLICSAFTVAELGEMLPPFISTSKIAGMSSLRWRCIFHIPPSVAYFEEEDTEADARAKMLIYLIEHNLMEINKYRKAALYVNLVSLPC